jgi:hypothetical protein
MHVQVKRHLLLIVIITRFVHGLPHRCEVTAQRYQPQSMRDEFVTQY